MSKPNLGITVEPLAAGKAEYLPLAATEEGGETGLKVVLLLRIKNNGSKKVSITGITYSFPGSSQDDFEMDDVNSYSNLNNLAPGAVVFWSNGMSHTDSSVNNAVFLDGAAPPNIKVDVFCTDNNGNDFDDPASITLPLAPHKSPVAGDAYIFPYLSTEMARDEYMSASGIHWANGGSMGTQIYAHDISCVGWSDEDGWSQLVPGGNRMKNMDYRIYNKAVLAMADGKVNVVVDGLDENTITLDDDGNLAFPASTPDGSGNHLTIQYGSEVVTYCHLKKGTIPAKLKLPDAPVKKGEMIGRVGNTGNATNPHTHIECERQSDNALRPLPFRDGWVIDQGELSPPGGIGPWFKLRGHGIPKDSVLIWPSRRNTEWLGWQDLGGTMKAPPAVTSWEPHRLDVFSKGSDDKLSHKWWDGTVWHDWQSLGGFFKGGPAAVSWGPHRIDVFVRGMDDHLGHLLYNGSQWVGWEDLGGNLTSAPAVCSWEEHRLDVFAAGSDGNLAHKWWDGVKWHDWQNLGGKFKGAPAVVSWGPHRIDVFVRGMDDHLGHLLYNGTSWSNWEDLGGPIASAPAVCSWEEHRLDVFASGTDDGELRHKWWDGSKWSSFDWVGGTYKDNPAAVSWGPNRIDVFTQGMDNHLGHLWRG